MCRFESVERTDRGEYICEASNNIGPAVNMTANLFVRFSPNVTVPRPRVKQAVGYNVLLQCIVNSFPTSAIYWLKDGEIIENKRRFSVANFNTGDASTRSTLKVSWKKTFWHKKELFTGKCRYTMQFKNFGDKLNTS